MTEFLYGILHFLWLPMDMTASMRLLWCLIFWLPILTVIYTISLVIMAISWLLRPARRPSVLVLVALCMMLPAFWWSIPVSFLAICGGLAGGNVTAQGYLLLWGPIAFPYLLTSVVCFALSGRQVTRPASSPQ